MTIPIPDSHIDLLERPICVVLTTMMSDGQPQSSLVWANTDGEHVLINTIRGRQKTKNTEANPKVTVLVIDPDDGTCWMEVRGEVELVEEGAMAHLEDTAEQYTGRRDFYGSVYPAAARDQHVRVICKIVPTKINVDAIFKE
jgi:PPOX class probable F420-dependent enzyme